MANKDKIAHDCKEILETELVYKAIGEITRFTPSINAGRRYMGVTIEGTPFLVTIQVEEAK